MITLPSRLRMGTVAGGGVAFNPSSLTSCLAWYDASDAATITLSGSVVTEWEDKIGGLVNTNIGSPTYDATNDEITTPTGDNLDNTTTSLVSVDDPNLTYVFLVEFPDLARGNGINDRFFGLGGDGNSGNLRHAQVGAGKNGYSWRYQGGAFAASSSVSEDTKYILSYTRQPQSTNEIFENGTSLSTGNMTNALDLRNTGATGVRIGAPLRNSNNMPTVFSEVIVLETVSDTDRQKCEGYIAHKWGRTSLLPVGHPYKAVAP